MLWLETREALPALYATRPCCFNSLSEGRVVSMREEPATRRRTQGAEHESISPSDVSRNLDPQVAISSRNRNLALPLNRLRVKEKCRKPKSLGG